MVVGGHIATGRGGIVYWPSTGTRMGYGGMSAIRGGDTGMTFVVEVQRDDDIYMQWTTNLGRVKS